MGWKLASIGSLVTLGIVACASDAGPLGVYATVSTPYANADVFESHVRRAPMPPLVDT
jgi:hypothetical protein